VAELAELPVGFRMRVASQFNIGPVIELDL